jgi:hypothetical protein
VEVKEQVLPEHALEAVRLLVNTVLPEVTEYTERMYLVAPEAVFHSKVGVVSPVTPLGEMRVGLSGGPYLKFIQTLNGPPPAAL